MAAIVNARDIALGTPASRLNITSAVMTRSATRFILDIDSTYTPATVTVVATPSGFGGSPTYVWEYALSSTPSTWVVISGGIVSNATNSTLTIASATFGGYIASNAFVTYKCTVSQLGLTSAINTAEVAITKNSDSAYYEITSTSPVITKNAIDAATAGTHTNITVTGKQIFGAKSITYGYLTLTSNLDSEGATTNPATITTTIANAAGATFYTARLYEAADKLKLLDTDIIPVVFTGASVGADGLTLVLTNESHTIPTDSSGNNPVHTGSGTEIYLYQGATQLEYDGVGTANGRWTVAASPTSITTGAISNPAGLNALVGDHTGISANTAKITYTITGKRTDGSAISLIKTQTFSKAFAGAPGATGNKSVTVSIFRWLNSVPTIASTLFTLTWSGFGVSATPASWTTSAGSPPATGYTLYQANLIVTDVAGATTTVADWTNATIGQIGYRADGSIGFTGASARVAYIVNTSSTAPLTPTAGTGDVAPTGWSFTATSTLTAGQYMYQSDGILAAGVGGDITWGVPYLSNLKVGSLSALAVDTGNLTVSTTGSIKNLGGSYGGAGFFLGYDTAAYKLSVGNGSTSMLSWDGTTLSLGAGSSIGGTTASTVVTNASNGNTANTNTANYQSSGAPTNNATLGTPTSVATADGNIVATIPWTVYSQGGIPADSLLVYVREAGGTVVATDPCFMVDIAATSFKLVIKPSTAYTFGIRAIRSVNAGIAATTIATSTTLAGIAGDYTANVGGTAASTVVTNAGNGNTAFNGTATFRTTGAPTNSPTGVGIAYAQTVDGNVVATVSYTYAQGATPADAIIVYIKETGGAIAVTDPCLATSPSTGSVKFIVKPGATYRFGVSASRVAAAGYYETAIVSTTDQVASASSYSGTVAGTATIGATTASTVVTNASNGDTAATQTTNFRNNLAPTNAPTLVSVAYTTSADGGVLATISYTYSQSTLVADTLVVYYKEGGGAVATSDPSVTTNPVTGTISIFVKPSTTYRFGVSAARVAAGGYYEGSIVSTADSPSGAGNYTGTINSTAASVVVSGAADGASALSAVNNVSTGLSARLSKSGSDILTGPISMNAASAILVGTTSDGLYLGNTGIVGKKAGATTFAVDQAGNATFAGTLGANVVTASSIATGAVTSASIGAGAVTTNKLRVVGGTGAALNPDPNCVDQSAWTGWSSQSAGTVTTITDGKSGSSVLRATTTSRSVSSILIPCSPTKTYRVSAWVRRPAAANGLLYLRTVQYTGAHTLPSQGLEYTHGIEAVTPPADTWTFYSAVFTPASSAITAFSPHILLNWGASTGYMEAQDIRLEEVIPGDLIVDGAITASKIVSDFVYTKAINVASKAVITAAGEASFKGLQILNSSDQVVFQAGSTNSLNLALTTPSNVPTGWLNSTITIDAAGKIQSIGSAGTSIANNVNNIIERPTGGVYTTQTPNVAGHIKIRLPFVNNTHFPMVKFTVDIYEYLAGYSCKLDISGHYSNTTWYSVAAQLVGGNVEYPVYFGNDGTYACIWIGEGSTESFVYPQVRVSNVFIGYSATDPAIWDSPGVTITIDQSARTNQTNQVLDAYPPADWSKTARKPTTLAGINSTEGTKLTGIETGATVGATAGTNLKDTQNTIVNDSRLLKNLLNSTAWVPDSTGGQTGFTATGVSSGGLNYMAYDTLPDGTIGTFWRARSGTAGTNRAEGGWDLTSDVTIDHSKLYRFTCWIRKFGGNPTTIYLGCKANSVRFIGSGTTNGNPYFLAPGGSSLTDSVWYLFVGYVYPSTYSGGQLSSGGYYDARTSAKSASGTDFYWVSGYSTANHRCFQYASAANIYCDFYQPRIDMCDGSEIPLDALLAFGKPSPRNLITSSNTTSYIASGALSSNGSGLTSALVNNLGTTDTAITTPLATVISAIVVSGSAVVISGFINVNVFLPNTAVDRIIVNGYIYIDSSEVSVQNIVWTKSCAISGGVYASVSIPLYVRVTSGIYINPGTHSVQTRAVVSWRNVSDASVFSGGGTVTTTSALFAMELKA